MIITVYFADKGTPKTGLVPTLNVWDTDGNNPVAAQNMTEIAGGFYQYSFTTFDKDKDYVIRADGGATLTGNDRYAIGSSELGDLDIIRKIETNKWAIVNKQLIIYDDDGTTVLYTFNLFDKSDNPADESVFSRVPA